MPFTNWKLNGEIVFAGIYYRPRCPLAVNVFIVPYFSCRYDVVCEEIQTHVFTCTKEGRRMASSWIPNLIQWGVWSTKITSPHRFIDNCFKCSFRGAKKEPNQENMVEKLLSLYESRLILAIRRQQSSFLNVAIYLVIQMFVSIYDGKLLFYKYRLEYALISKRYA